MSDAGSVRSVALGGRETLGARHSSGGAVMARVSVWLCLVLAVAVLTAACDGDEGSAARSDPATVVVGYVAAYNA